MQHDQAPTRALQGGTTTVPGRVPDAEAVRGAGRPVASPVTTLPRTRVRGLTRRAHARIPGTTAANLERQAWGETGREQPLASAVSVVPGAGLPVTFRRPVGGADLAVVLGPRESGVAPGRHRRPHPAWHLLRHVPGWRSPVPSAEGGDHGAAVDGADPWAEAGGMSLVDVVMSAADAADPGGTGTATGSPDGGELLPLTPGDGEPAEPAYRRRQRRSPAPATRSAVQVAQARIQAAHGRPEIARAVAEEAAGLVDADITALVLRAVEGPRVLWIHPGGTSAEGLWGPATLAALLRVGHPVRRVVEGDPLADGRPTALLAVPVPAGGTIAGSLLARRDEARTFNATEQDVLGRIARMAGAALLAASRPSPRGHVDVDGVTGLPGPGRFAAEVEAAVRAADRQGIPVAVLAVHVEGLSRLRAELGEATADETLRAVVRAVGGVLRVGDLAYRIGVDELALLLPATDAANLPQIRERLDAVVADVVPTVNGAGDRHMLGLRSSGVRLDGAGAGHQVIDAANRALELDRQKVRWTTG